MTRLGAAGRSALASAREALLLEHAARLAAGTAASARPRLRALVRAARDRVHEADCALEDGHAASALPLYREGAVLFMAARVTADTGEPPSGALSAEEVLARFRALPVGADADAPAALVRTAPTLAETPETVVRAEAARATVRWLGTLVEPRGLEELRFNRTSRLGAVGLALVALVFGPASGLFGRPNLALHKPVSVSGLYPGAMSSPAGLTDGVIAGAPYGVHTQVGDSPWVQVDLLGVHRIDTVKIYNRGDGWLEDGLPMTLQLSEDGVRFMDVETRTTSFTQDAPWIAKPHGRSARYVRIRGSRNRYVTLSEVQVFGR